MALKSNYTEKLTPKPPPNLKIFRKRDFAIAGILILIIFPLIRPYESNILTFSLAQNLKLSTLKDIPQCEKTIKTVTIL